MTVTLTNAHVWDGIHSEPWEGSLTIESGQIVNTDAKLRPLHKSDREIDCKGLFLIPGLIDAHVHIGAIDIEVEEQQRRYTATYLALRMAQRLRRWLEWGFTTVRDAGSADLGMKRAVQEGIIDSPDLLISGHALTQTGGHGDFRSAVEPGGGYFDGEVGLTHVVVDGEEEVRKAVREQLRRGADSIKLYTSAGPYPPTGKVQSAPATVEFSLPEMRVAVEEAEDHGSFVSAHANTTRSIERSVRAGVRSIEHGTNLDPETAESMFRSGTYLVPTLAWFHALASGLPKYRVSKAVQERASLALEASCRSLEVAGQAKVAIGFGTDLVGPTLSNLGNGISLQAEVIGSLKALLSATRTNAELLRLTQKGTIEEGKQADLVVCERDPTQNVDALAVKQEIRLVVKAGKVYKNSLNRM